MQWGGGRGAGTELQSPSTASIRSYTDERIEIAVSAGADGYLLLADAYYPGWRATVDGQPTSIYRADAMFRAVSIPAGEHTVVFEYRPAWYPRWSSGAGMAETILTAYLWRSAT
jgi:uncharacterized membrane protein YfhO